MKRWIVLLLAVVLVLSLAACGGKAENPAEEPQDVPSETQDGGEGSEQPEDTAMTKEEMLEQALEVDSATIHRDSLENLANAKDLYCSKILLLEGTVLEIQEDCAVIGTILTDDAYVTDAYLPQEDLAKLQQGQQITVVGQTDDTITEESLDAPDFPMMISHYAMPTAYLTQDHFEVEGIIKGKNESYAGAWNFFVGDSDLGRIVYFADGTDLSGLDETYSSEGNPVTISAKIIRDSDNGVYGDTFVYQDAAIVAVEQPQQGAPDERLLTFNHEDREFFKEYVADLEPMDGEAVQALLTDATFSMRNNYGGDGDGTHTITFHADGTLDASYTSDGKEYTMYESWRLENGSVVCTDSFINNFGETTTTDTRFTPYQYDDTRYLLIDAEGDKSMVLTQQ